MTSDAATATPASTVIFNLIGKESCQISRVRSNLFGVSSPTTILRPTSIQNENEMKYEAGQTQTQIQMQSQHAPHPANKPLDIDITDAAPGEFDDLEYLFGALLSADGVNVDRNTLLNIGV